MIEAAFFDSEVRTMKIFGYVIIGILAVFALLLCAAVIRAVMIKKKPSGKESAIKYTLLDGLLL